MFTGIIESLGEVVSLDLGHLLVRLDEFADDPIKVGESVAVNGCCLTVIGTSPLAFDLSEETLRKTALADLAQGGKVNVERAMKASGRFGGHIVQGHVDATGVVSEIEQTEQAHRLRFNFPLEFGRYMIEKGSVSINGISLTVVDLAADRFDVWIIPHTWANTNLHALKMGDRVNLEFDVLAKYVESLTGSRQI